MSLYHTLYRDFFLPAYQPERYGGLRTQWRELERREAASDGENRDRQWQAVRRVLKYAYEATRFYRERFDQAGLTPDKIQSPADLQRIPLLTRNDIRTRLEDLTSNRYRAQELAESATGGTTDTPVTLRRSPESMQFRTAVQLRFNAWAGANPGDKFFWLWGAQGDFVGAPSWRWRMWERHVLRRLYGQTSRLNEEMFEQYRRAVTAYRPKIFMAYPTPLALFCEYLAQSGKPFHKPKAALVTAEVLLPEQREVIRNTLGIDPYVQYGTRDFGMIAAECSEHNGMHLSPMSAFVELIPLEPGNPQTVYDVVVTDLTNLAMPLIRYAINDCAIPATGSCACGRGYPRVQEFIGRMTDNFYLADGTVVSGVVLPGRILKVCPGILKMQIIQETYSDFRIRYIPGAEFQSENLQQVATKLRQYTGDVKVEFEQVMEIPREKSGKTRFFISKVQRAMPAAVAGGKANE